MQALEEIKIFWEGPFKIDDILNDNIDKKEYDVRANGQGLYQIYGCHPLYGNGVLLYIGRTKGKNGFKSRLKGRWVIEDGSDTENIEIYLGTIFSDSKKIEDDSDMIDKSEVLLINAMKPAYNSSNIQSANEDFVNKNFILHNDGNYRNLYPVLDSKYFWQPYKNFAIVNRLAENFHIKLKELNIYDNEYYGFELNDIGKFKINNYVIWFGISYEEWNVSKVPLELQVSSEDKKIMKKIKSLKLDEFKYIESDDEKEKNYFQIEFTKDFFELESKNLKEAFEIKVNEIISLMKF